MCAYMCLCARVGMCVACSALKHTVQASSRSSQPNPLSHMVHSKDCGKKRRMLISWLTQNFRKMTS